jgi:RimJ/RimL family protein N-acetyltransferase
VAKQFREEGVGTILIEQTIMAAISQLSNMKIVELGVFGNNPIAIHLYKKFGFKEYGRLPEGILHRGEYIDHIYMYKQV